MTKKLRYEIIEMVCPDCKKILKIVQGGEFDGFMQPDCAHACLLLAKTFKKKRKSKTKDK